MNFKTILKVVFGVVLVSWGVKVAYFELTDGFSVANISSAHKDDPQWEIPALSTMDAQEVENALNQKYHYLDKGHQAYVFESEDSKYVLKFLKFQKYRHHPMVQALPLPASLNEKRQKQTLHKEDKRDALFKSWKIAFTKLKDETQVLFIHINRTPHLEKEITLYNKIGIAYHLNLADYVFMLQRKAELFADVIERDMKNGNSESAKELLDGLVALYQNEYRQGLFEEDRYIVRNTGVYLNKPIQIDTGRLREDESYKDPKRQAKEILWKTVLLQDWLDENYPELATYFKHVISDRTVY
jgi:hypothetical protein